MNLHKKHTLIFLTFLPLVTFIIFFFLKISGTGYIIYTDVTESTNLNRLYDRYLYMYSEDIGEAFAEKARIPIVSVIIGTLKIFSLGAEWYNKLKFLTLILCTIVAFYLTSLLLMKKTLKIEKVSSKQHIYVTIGTLFYVTNFWMTNRLMHFQLFFAAVTIPVFFYVLYDYFFSEKLKYHLLIGLAVFSAIFTATPHIILFEAFIIFVVTLIYVLQGHHSFNKKFSKISTLSIFAAFYIALNAYWLLPTLKSNSAPDAVPSEDIVEFLGKNSSISNEINLTGYLLTSHEEYFPHNQPILAKVFEYITYLPLIIFLIFLWQYRKHKISFILAVLFVLAIFLSSITPLSKAFYFYLMFYSPIRSFGWIFREVDKFGIFIGFTYSLAVIYILHAGEKHKQKLSLLIVTTLLVLIPNVYFLNQTLNKYYTPQQIPADFDAVNNYLSSDVQNFNVLWYPGVPEPTWAKTEEVQYVFSNLISSKPAITTRSDMNHYIGYTMDTNNLDQINLGKALDIVGVKYLILRNDHDDEKLKNVLEQKLSQQLSIHKVLSTGNLDVYENKAFSGITKFYTRRFVTNIGLEILKSLDEFNIDTNNTLIDYTDNPFGTITEALETYYFIVEGNALEYKINRFRDNFIFPADFLNRVENGNGDQWRKSSLKDLKHAESTFFLESTGIYNSQLDYDRLVASAYDGLQFKNASEKSATNIDTMVLSFNKHPNVRLDKNQLFYTPLTEDYKYEWNVMESDSLVINNIKGLYLQAKTTADPKLLLHIKFKIYDKSGNVINSVIARPDLNNKIDRLIKIDSSAITAKVSVWTKSLPNQKERYQLNLLKLTNVSNNVEPLALKFRIPNNSGCKINCVVLARTYKGTEGGSININVDGNNANLNTKGNQDMYLWQYVEDIPYLNKNTVDIEITNNTGFNSINALVFIPKNYYMDINTRLDKPDINFLTNNQSRNIIQNERINSTMYKINIPTGITGILAFDKPYNTNWTLGNDKSSIANGFVNGWEIKQQTESDNLVIEFRPQKYFYIGALVSAITAVVCVLIAFMWVNETNKV